MRILSFLTTVIIALTPLTALTGCVKTQSDHAATANAEFVGDPIDNGEISFELYCTSCHGEKGYGDGPVAAALNTQPANLAMLTQKYDGIFPAEEIYEYVDGRKDLSAHGTRDMPVWGNVWREEGSHQSQGEVDVRLRELVAYIRSIQE